MSLTNSKYHIEATPPLKAVRRFEGTLDFVVAGGCLYRFENIRNFLHLESTQQEGGLENLERWRWHVRKGFKILLSFLSLFLSRKKVKEERDGVQTYLCKDFMVQPNHLLI